MNPSKYQADFYNEVKTTNNNIMVKACAGAGKTTSIVEACNYLPKYKKNLFCAFNKSIASELAERLPQHVECSTLHSLGFKIIRKNRSGRIKLNNYKNLSLLDPLMKDKELKEKTDPMMYKFVVSDIVHYLRITDTEQSMEGIKSVIEDFGILTYEDEHLMALKLLEVLKKYNSGKHKDFMIDFDDMICLPVTEGMSYDKYDVIVIDELNDLNKAQHNLVNMLLKENSRIIGVGDENQSIYGFSGADTSSMNNFKTRFNTKELPLSVCYRCGTDIVAHAQEINPEIEAFEQNEKGEIFHKSSIGQIDSGDIVICRNVFPLIKLYYQLLDKDKKVTLVGKDMLSGLKQMLNKLDGMSKKEAKIHVDAEKEYIIEMLTNEGIKNPTSHKKYVKFEEKTEILLFMLDKNSYISEVKTALEKIFDNNRADIKLMTGHKSKGLEANRVFYLHKFAGKRLIPSEYAKSPEDQKQEMNLEYVIRTRAKKELHYIEMM